MDAHYNQPGWFTRHVFGRLVAALTRAGVSVWGSQVLEVPGRKSGLPARCRSTCSRFHGAPYLVSPRGETEWVRNARAAEGQVTLIRGRRRQGYTAVELGDPAKPELLRAYLARWKFEVGMFFDGVGPDSTDEQLAAIAERHPVFRLEPVSPGVRGS